MWLGGGGGEGRFAQLPLGSGGEHGVPVAWEVLGNRTGGAGRWKPGPYVCPGGTLRWRDLGRLWNGSDLHRTTFQQIDQVCCFRVGKPNP